MNYRPFGNSGFSVSEIGFGTWGIGGNLNGSIAYGATTDDESRTALREAFARGITFYDTSDFYGYGHSEILLGEEFSSVRDQIVLSTKAGFVDANRQDFTPATLAHSLAQSLKRLRSPHLDVFFFHSPDLKILRETAGALELMQAWRRDGRVRCWGISTRSPEDAVSAIQDFGAECIQVNFNLADLRAIKIGLWELCEKEKIGVVVRTPFAFGFLTGTIAANQSFSSDDHRRRFTTEQQDRWRKSLGIYRQVFAGESPATSAQNALRFCLGFKAVSTVIPGMLTAAQVRENAEASALPTLSSKGLDTCVQIGFTHDFV